MPFLLRVALPDVPGSLGRVATAIGEAGGDIEAIEIVEKRHDGTAVDDVLLEMAPGAMPDSVVSACQPLEGVEVIWISRYAAGGNLFLDLEVVEELTANPGSALDTLVGLLPVTFRVDWAARLSAPPAAARADGHRRRPARHRVDRAAGRRADGRVRRETASPCTARRPLGDDGLVVLGRDGGPEFLDSELARLAHLVALAASISRS